MGQSLTTTLFPDEFHKETQSWSWRNASIDEEGTFSGLPAEIFDNIIRFMDYEDLRNCMFMNSRFHFEIKRRLCRRARLRLNGSADDANFLQWEAEVVERVDWSDTDNDDGPAVRTVSGPVFKTRWSREFFKDGVRCLDIDSHAKTSCCTIDWDDKSPNSTQSQIVGATTSWAVRLNLANVDGRALFHTDGNPEVKQDMCKIFASWWNLRTIIFRNVPAYLRGVDGILPASILGKTQSTVYLLGPLFLGAHGTTKDTLWLHTLLNQRSITDATVVFTSMPGEDFTPVLPEHEEWSDDTWATWFERLNSSLVVSSFQIMQNARSRPEVRSAVERTLGYSRGRTLPEVRLTIVNAGAIPKRYLRAAGAKLSTTKAVQHHVEKMYRDSFAGINPPELADEISRFAKAIQFLSMKEYMTGEGRYALDGDMAAAWDAVSE